MTTTLHRTDCRPAPQELAPGLYPVADALAIVMEMILRHAGKSIEDLTPYVGADAGLRWEATQIANPSAAPTVEGCDWSWSASGGSYHPDGLDARKLGGVPERCLV